MPGVENGAVDLPVDRKISNDDDSRNQFSVHSFQLGKQTLENDSTVQQSTVHDLYEWIENSTQTEMSEKTNQTMIEPFVMRVEQQTSSTIDRRMSTELPFNKSTKVEKSVVDLIQRSYQLKNAVPLSALLMAFQEGQAAADVGKQGAKVAKETAGHVADFSVKVYDATLEGGRVAIDLTKKTAGHVADASVTAYDATKKAAGHVADVSVKAYDATVEGGRVAIDLTKKTAGHVADASVVAFDVSKKAAGHVADASVTAYDATRFGTKVALDVSTNVINSMGSWFG